MTVFPTTSGHCQVSYHIECLTIESLVSDHGLDLDMGIRIGRTAVPWRTWIPIQPINCLRIDNFWHIHTHDVGYA